MGGGGGNLRHHAWDWEVEIHAPAEYGKSCRVPRHCLCSDGAAQAVPSSPSPFSIPPSIEFNRLPLKHPLFSVINTIDQA